MANKLISSRRTMADPAGAGFDPYQTEKYPRTWLWRGRPAFMKGSATLAASSASVGDYRRADRTFGTHEHGEKQRVSSLRRRKIYEFVTLARRCRGPARSRLSRAQGLDGFAHARIEPGAACVEMRDDGLARARIQKLLQMGGDAVDGALLALRDEELADLVGHIDELIGRRLRSFLIRCGCVNTSKPSLRATAIKVMPAACAMRTASAVGADMAISMGMPMAAAFWIISTDSRLVTMAKPPSPDCRARAKVPASLSSAL